VSPARCCRAGGYVTPDKVALLRLLDTIGLGLPDDARVFGPGDGHGWRVVDYRGRTTLAVGSATIEDTLTAADTAAWSVAADGGPHVVTVRTGTV
jgi:hypothetical protein